ncbi:Putative threonine efflux protein [Corynebacterium glyciniphilum AJ 3170]|uniref:Putative threonine efflux protein n=1 Tax=Corynebacterium glyciniphilum AJ 3170 TaxID=1404245 RepID=X5E881_9CORY|nr:LysE family translocator [Corynebacterium glyciniphilum]AHW63650.1 Putative threonine efflux protein [Corynebacterium glyciniphilum AJ 3170]
MDQFAAVALAHFLALLIPGVDFFLIVRLSVAEGWRRASAACLGIAVANGVIIAAAFSGLAMIQDPAVLGVVQLAGGLFLIYIGVAFLRSMTGEKRDDLAVPERAAACDGTDGTHNSPWVRNVGLGLASGLLNPKNALFYVSLATAVSGAGAMALTVYGAWMVGLVLVWDLLVAVLFGSARALRRLGSIVPWLTRIAGGFLVLFGVVMVAELFIELG